MASVKLITPQNKPKYFKLTANVVANGEKKRYYSRFEFDRKVEIRCGDGRGGPL